MTIKHRPIFILIAITILIYLSVDIFYKVVNAKLVSVKAERTITEKVDSHKVVKKQSLNTYRVISERNLFGSGDRVIGGGKQIDLDELEATKLNLALLGTVCSNSNFDFAVIEETDKKKQGLFRVGDAVATATVVKIMRGIVVLRVGDSDEILKMKEGDPGKKNVERTVSSPKGKITVRKTDIDDAFKNMGQMMTQVRIKPYFSAGKPDGFMISRIKRGSMFNKMGLKNGDVIQGVNDQPMVSADDMLELYRSLKTGSEITLNIKRRGKQERLKYIVK